MADRDTIKRRSPHPDDRSDAGARAGKVLDFRGSAATALACAEPASIGACSQAYRLPELWMLYCEAIARLRKSTALLASPARAEAQLRLTLPRLMRWLERDWDAERRLLDPASRRVFDRVLFDCLRAGPTRSRWSARRVRGPRGLDRRLEPRG